MDWSLYKRRIQEQQAKEGVVFLIFDTVRGYLFDCKQIKKNPREVWATDKKLVSLCGTPCLSRFQITLLLGIKVTFILEKAVSFGRNLP